MMVGFYFIGQEVRRKLVFYILFRPMFYGMMLNTHWYCVSLSWKNKDCVEYFLFSEIRLFIWPSLSLIFQYYEMQEYI